MTFKRPDRPRREREDTFDGFTPKARPTAPSVMATALHERPPTPAKAKVQGRKVQAIRDAARDEPCTMEFDDVCNRDPATSVWAHWPGLDGDRGMGIKSIDLAGAIACSACHDVLDGRTRVCWLDRIDIDRAFLRGHLKSLLVLARKGLL
jgi:hypothetical protein